MKGFDFLKVSPENTCQSQMNLGNEMVSSIDFSQIVPLYSLDVIAKDKINLTGNVFARLAPLPLPTYGAIHFKHASVFVPYSSFIPEYDAFRSSSKYDRGFLANIRWTKQWFIDQLIVFMFCDNLKFQSLPQFVEHFGCQPDFYIRLYDGEELVPLFCHLHNRGRFYLKVLECLGYVFGTHCELSSDFTGNTTYCQSGAGSENVSLLPLLSYFKAFNDNIEHPQLRAFSKTALFLSECSKLGMYWHTDGSFYLSDTSHIEGLMDTIAAVFDSIYPYYDNDYLTSAWKHPNSPITQDNNTSPFSSSLVPDNFKPFYSDRLSSPILADDEATVQDSTVQHNYQQNVLIDRLHKFILRNNLAGSNAVEKILSRFGLAFPTKKVNYSELIETGSSVIQIGDITAMTEYLEQPLGSYAGKGILSDKSINCKFDVKQDGFFMVLCWLDVKPYYIHRADAHIYHTKPLHFYNEMFDGLQGQPIRLSELGNHYVDSDFLINSKDNEVFGYCNSYDEYRFKHNKVTGDMALLNRLPDMKQWYLYRDTFELRRHKYFAMSRNLLEQDTQYDYIFNDQNTDYDHFYLNCLFDNKMVRPIKSFSQTSGLRAGSLEVMRNGSHV
ncbi:major capsid protein [Capybara microvirus Cap3_SP_347]|nr:major capsid protein [Capybara microvirus Cap3_SP_347]